MSTDERALAESAQNQLEEAGFFVTREVEHARRGVRVRADIVAYASDESGALKPEIVVELKRGRGKLDRSSALAQLSRVQCERASESALGEVEESWFGTYAYPNMRYFNRMRILRSRCFRITLLWRASVP